MQSRKSINMWGGMTAVVLLSSSLFIVNQSNEIKNLKNRCIEEQEQHQLLIEKHEQEAKQLTEQLNSKLGVIEGLQQQINQLESEVESLEGVQQNIISNVGYMPNDYERNLLERLVECEAGAETMQGKIAVANVVLNRVKSKEFPNSISKVIYQKNQFEPVVTGIINSKTPSQDSIEAVKRAFLGEKVVDSDIVTFWASWLNRNNEICWSNRLVY